jgi:dTDP-4-amino-4,6-dideoxygalactose transaminase
MSVFISSTPTTEEDDLKLCKKLLKEDAVNDLNIQLPGFDNIKHFYTNTGRASLYIILKALGISEGDEVIIQSFTCMAVVVPLVWLKIKPIYSDIDLDTYNISLRSIKNRISDKTRAVIVQHTFGIPADIDEIRRYLDEINSKRTKEERVYLIEDCAHCLNIKIDDKYLGSFGDVSFFSFGQDKVVSTTQGGCIISNDENLEKMIEKFYSDIPEMPENMVKYNLRYPRMWSLIKRHYFEPQLISNSNRFSKFTLGKFFILLFRFLGLIKPQASSSDFGSPINDVFKLSNKQKHLLKNQIEKIDKFSKHREECTREYSRFLERDLTGSLIRYPILVDNPSLVKKELQRIRVIAGNWYNYPVIPRGIDLDKVQYQLGSCPNTEYAMEHIINLPTGLDVSNDDLKKITSIVKNHVQNE